MNINRRQRRCPKRALFFLSPLSRHYKFSPGCNPISLSSPPLPSHDDLGDMLPAGLPDDLSRSSEHLPILNDADTEANIISNLGATGTGSSDTQQGQQGLNSASTPYSPSHVAAPNDLVEEDEYERFISDCNSPHTTTLFPAHSVPPLGTLSQPTTASLQANHLPATGVVTSTGPTGLASGRAFLLPLDFDKG